MSQHATLDAWVSEAAALCGPDHIHWCDGSAAEHDNMLRILVQAGTAIPLNPELRPDSFLVRSHPADVARVEDRTFICSATREGAGPTNNWADPTEMKATLRALFAARWRDGRSTSSPTAWGPSARRSRTSGWS